MQPYFLPYFEYFGLVAAVDDFVFLDNVQFSRKGFVQRNQFNIAASKGLGARKLWFSVPLAGASQHKLISEILISKDTGKLFDQLDSWLRGSQFRHDVDLVLDFVRSAVGGSETIADLNVAIIMFLADLFGLKTRFHLASSYGVGDATGQNRILKIVAHVSGSIYLNLPGGSDLYSFESFEDQGISLQFVDPSLNVAILKDRYFFSIIQLIGDLGIRRVANLLGTTRMDVD